MTSYSDAILGKWSRIKDDSLDTGLALEHYLDDGSKDCHVTVFKLGGVRELIKAGLTWSIDKNILTENITFIDKKFPALKKLKSGCKIRSYIVELNESQLTLKILTINGVRHNHEIVTYYRAA
jgi:hypothetical protein